MNNSDNSLLITVCARGGSKGVPQKNILMLGDKPLIAYTILAAQAFAQKHGAQIVLSTEDDTIASVAADFGLRSDYLRPTSLADDHAGKVSVIQDALLFAERHYQKRYDVLLDLDVSSPLRNQEDLDVAYEQFQSNANTLTLFSVNPAHRNPYFNMVEQTSDGAVKLSKRTATTILSRQAAPNVYDINGSFYFYRRSFFDSGHEGVIQDNRSDIYVMPHMCFDVDTPMDLMIMRLLIEENKLDFDFD